MMKQEETQPQRLADAADLDVTIPVIEEVPRVEKEVVDTGSVRVKKTVDEETVEIPLLIREHTYQVERVPVNRYVAHAPPAIRHEGDTTIIPVIVEEVVVQKRLKIVEEVRITAVLKEDIRVEQIALKKEKVFIEHDHGKSNNQS